MNWNLYKSHSIIKNSNIPGLRYPEQATRVSWYRVGPRELEDHHYSNIIVNYDNMDINLQKWMRWIMDSYFTEDEKNQLESFVLKHLGWPIRSTFCVDSNFARIEVSVKKYPHIKPTRITVILNLILLGDSDPTQTLHGF